MSKKPVNQRIAEALQHYMQRGGWNNTTLGEAAGVAANTIKNCLEPASRSPGASGKAPSVKTGELDMIAKALGVDITDLVQDMSAEERQVAERTRIAAYYMQHGEMPPDLPKPEPRKPRHMAA